MNFSIHLDEATLARLSAAVERFGLPRNRLIAAAVREWLERNEQPDWPGLLAQHFRNPAPELLNEVLDVKACRDALQEPEAPRW